MKENNYSYEEALGGLRRRPKPVCFYAKMLLERGKEVAIVLCFSLSWKPTLE